MSRPTFVAKSMCLFFHEGKVLLFEAQTKTGSKFIRPPGGHIEYGEYAIDTAKREIREELGVEAQDVKQLTMIENIFKHDGVLTHEYVFIFSARFVDPAFYQMEKIPFFDDAKSGFLEWYDISSLKNSTIPVVPNGVLEECLTYIAR